MVETSKPHAFWRQQWVLLWALAVSVALHALLLGLRFVDPEQLERVLPAQALELILVNARTAQAPLRATALAQANLDGGGRADAGRASTPLEASERVRAGDALREAEAQLQRLQQQQMLMLSKIKNQLAQIEAAAPGAEHDGSRATDQQAQRKALATLVAQIERRIQEENARPRKRFVSAASREAVFALYYDRMRQRLEAEGTAHFPSHQGRRLYGGLVMAVTVNHDGRVLDVEVLEPSGQSALDRAAVAITKRQRFGAFDAALRRQTDQLVVISRYQFLRDDSVQTQLVPSS
jgi:periplasmic protein TonB